MTDDIEPDFRTAIQGAFITMEQFDRIALARLHADFQPAVRQAREMIPTLADDVLIALLAEPLANAPKCSTCVHWNPNHSLINMNKGMGVCYRLSASIGSNPSIVAYPISTGPITIGTRHDFCCSEWVEK